MSTDENARKEAGHQLSQVQVRINLDDGWFRVISIAKFPEAVYALHCFKKKTTSTSKHDKDITAARYKAVIQERSKK